MYVYILQNMGLYLCINPCLFMESWSYTVRGGSPTRLGLNTNPIIFDQSEVEALDGKSLATVPCNERFVCDHCTGGGGGNKTLIVIRHSFDQTESRST